MVLARELVAADVLFAKTMLFTSKTQAIQRPLGCAPEATAVAGRSSSVPKALLMASISLAHEF